MKYIECILLSVQYTDDYSFDSDTGIDNDIDQLRNDSIDLFRSINNTYNQFVIPCLLYFKVYFILYLFIYIENRMLL